MKKVEAILLKPLDGAAIGAVASFDQRDFERLKGQRAVRERTADDDEAVALAEFLQRLNDPVNGPAIAREMKASFDRNSEERNQALNDLAALRATHSTLTSDHQALTSRHGEVATENERLKAEVSRLTEQAAAQGGGAGGEREAIEPANKMTRTPANKGTAPAETK